MCRYDTAMAPVRSRPAVNVLVAGIVGVAGARASACGGDSGTDDPGAQVDAPDADTGDGGGRGEGGPAGDGGKPDSNATDGGVDAGRCDPLKKFTTIASISSLSGGNEQLVQLRADESK